MDMKTKTYKYSEMWKTYRGFVNGKFDTSAEFDTEQEAINWTNQ